MCNWTKAEFFLNYEIFRLEFLFGKGRWLYLIMGALSPGAHFCSCGASKFPSNFKLSFRFIIGILSPSVAHSFLYVSILPKNFKKEKLKRKSQIKNYNWKNIWPNIDPVLTNYRRLMNLLRQVGFYAHSLSIIKLWTNKTYNNAYLIT